MWQYLQSRPKLRPLLDAIPDKNRRLLQDTPPHKLADLDEVELTQLCGNELLSEVLQAKVSDPSSFGTYQRIYRGSACDLTAAVPVVIGLLQLSLSQVRLPWRKRVWWCTQYFARAAYVWLVWRLCLVHGRWPEGTRVVWLDHCRRLQAAVTRLNWTRTHVVLCAIACCMSPFGVQLRIPGGTQTWLGCRYCTVGTVRYVLDNVALKARCGVLLRGPQSVTTLVTSQYKLLMRFERQYSSATKSKNYSATHSSR